MSFQSGSRRETNGHVGTSRNDNYTDSGSRQMAGRLYRSIDEYRTSSRSNSNRGSGVEELSSGNFDKESTSSFGGRSGQYYRGTPVGHRENIQGNLEGFSNNDLTDLGSSDFRSSIGGSGMSGQGYLSDNLSGGNKESFGGNSEDAYSNGSFFSGQRGNEGDHFSCVSVSGPSSRIVSRGQRDGFDDSYTTSTSIRMSGGNSADGQRGGTFSSRSIGGLSGGGLTGAQRGDYGGSYSSSTFGGFSGVLGVGDTFLQCGEKETMQNLNSRLAVYLEKVNSLEAANCEIEGKIRHWYETNKPEKTDNSKYFEMIEDLRDKVIAAKMDNYRVTLRIDNARIAADDFKQKYETELCMRQNMESDVNRLRKMLDDITLDRSSLEAELESKRVELTFIKKNHEEEMRSLQKTTGDVSVQVEAAPGISIRDILDEMRAKYEDLAEQNHRKAEADFNHKIVDLNLEISSHSDQIQSGQSEVTELRRTMQTLEIDLQAQLAMNNSMENTLAETEAGYCSQLAQIQVLIDSIENQLSQARNDMERESMEYNMLLDTKTRLENEIEMYRRLLDAEGEMKYKEWSSTRDLKPISSPVPDEKKSRLVTTIIEERVNGKVVSTKVDKIEQKL